MKKLGAFTSLLGVSFLFLGALSAGAESPSAKIYLNGEWVDAAKTVTVNAENSLLDSFFGKQKIDLTRTALQFLQQNTSLLQMDKKSAWETTQQQIGPQWQTQRLKKTWAGLPVVGGDAVVHVAGTELAFANADNTPLAGLSLDSVRIKPEEAKAVAFASYNGKAAFASEPELKVLVLGNGNKKEAKLVYEITVRDRDQFSSDIHFISAETARELLVTTNVLTVNRKVVSGVGDEYDFQLDDTAWPVVFAENGCQPGLPDDQDVTNPNFCNEVEEVVGNSARFAWTNSGLVHEYYESMHGRNSIDGKGAAIQSVVNFGGEKFANAAWLSDRSLMIYGRGRPTILNDFASPLDVVAHEITHGITSRTSNLIYAGEPGALNESYSDVFGKLVELRSNPNADWKIGRALFKVNGRYIRDMENPEVDHMDRLQYRGEECDELNDFCGVHVNSGIPNRAAVMIAQRIGTEKLGQLYYLTLTQLLRPNSDFKEAKDQTMAACMKLLGPDSFDCVSVSDAYATVGIM